MAELHIDDDWKKQAQEEKQQLAEAEAKRAAGATATAPAPGGGPAPSPTPGAPRAGAARGRGQRELPPANFASLVQGVLTQALFYLGDLAPQGSEPMLNLDMAKHQIDTLSVLEDKTKGNLTEDEQRLLDAALYEVRMRYVSVASQYL